MVYSGHHGDFHNPGGTGGDAVLGEHQRHRAVLIQIEGGGVIHSGEAALLRGEEEAALIRRDLRIYGVIADADPVLAQHVGQGDVLVVGQVQVVAVPLLHGSDQPSAKSTTKETVVSVWLLIS